MSDDAAFAATVAARAAKVPGVLAVTLGGSRAQGIHRPDSDWDFGLYYRGRLDPDDVRALGWEGEISAPGEWGGGIMNGGAWLTVEGRRVDLIYRDLDEVEHWSAEAEHGRFDIQRLLFYVAGIPTYVLPGELALNRVLIGELPRPAYPQALRKRAADRWRAEAVLTLDQAEKGADATHRTGLVAMAIIQLAHARLAARGTWVLNEKRIVAQAGLTWLGELLVRPEEAIAAARRTLRA